MTIKPVTSLADLEFKAKNDKNYQQLAILGCRLLRSTCKTYTGAIKKIYQISLEHDPDSCTDVINILNKNCDKIKPQKKKITKLSKKSPVKKIKRRVKST